MHRFRLMPFLLLTAALLPSIAGLDTNATAAEAKEPAKPPVYAAYKYEKDGKHIYFGTQPLAAPEGVIEEVMKRDPILRKELEKLGMKIVFYPFAKGPEINTFILQDKIDIAISGDMPTIAIAATDKVIITAIAKLSRASIVTRNVYHELRDLKGRKIGCPEGTTAHLGLLSALAASDMKESDIKLIPMDVGEMISAMEHNRIDAFSAWEPTPSEALSRHKDYTAIHRFLNSSYLYQTRDFAQKHPEASLQVHASFIRAMHWLNSSNKNLELAAKWLLESAEKLSGRKSTLSLEQVARVTAEGISRIAKSPLIPQTNIKRTDSLSRAYDFLKKQGKMPAQSSWEKVRSAMDNSIVKAILADPARYQLGNFYPEQGN